MDLFCLLPSPGAGVRICVPIDTDTSLEIGPVPDALDDTWLKDLGRFRAEELGDAGWVVTVIRPLAAGGDPSDLSRGHDRLAQNVFRALRLAGLPGHGAGLRLAGIRQPGKWKTLHLSTVRPRTRNACHAASPWDSGTFATTVSKVVARLETLYDDQGNARVRTHERLLRCIRAAEIGMQMDNAYERFPAFTRVVEGLVTVGSKKKPQETMRGRVQLIAQTSTLPAADLVGDVYRIRNKILHMDSWKAALSTVPAQNREQVARARYAAIEVLACHVLYEILASDELFRHYESDGTIGALWDGVANGAIANPWPVLAAWDAAEILEWSPDPAVPPARRVP